MDYREWPVAEALAGLVKTVWSLDAGGPSTVRVSQDAIPDGCIDIIRRLSGRSDWRRAQPDRFVAGLIETPAMLTMSGDARFVGVRLWPWAWNLLGGPPTPEFLDDWRPLAPEALGSLILSDPEAVMCALQDAFGGMTPPALAHHILRSRNVAELSIRSGLSYRQLQRWFSAEIGLAPRRYLKLLRFQQAFVDVTTRAQTDADPVAPIGPASVLHAARAVGAIAGARPATIQKRSHGPLLPSAPY